MVVIVFESKASWLYIFKESNNDDPTIARISLRSIGPVDAIGNDNYDITLLNSIFEQHLKNNGQYLIIGHGSGNIIDDDCHLFPFFHNLPKSSASNWIQDNFSDILT